MDKNNITISKDILLNLIRKMPDEELLAMLETQSSENLITAKDSEQYPTDTNTFDIEDDDIVFSPSNDQQLQFEAIELSAGATPDEAKASAERSMHDMRTLANYPCFLPAAISPEDMVVRLKTAMLDGFNDTATKAEKEDPTQTDPDDPDLDDINALLSEDDNDEEQYFVTPPSTNQNILQQPAPIEWIDSNALQRRLQNITEAENRSSYRTLINRMSVNKAPLSHPADSAYQSLHETFPNFAEVIDFYKSQFRLCKLTGRHRISPVLLLGDPGIGKTHFAKSFAALLGTGYDFIDLPSATDAWVLSGLDVSWRGAKAGKIFEAMVTSPTVSPVILLDEIEKTNRSDRSPLSPLYQLLEETNAKEFIDEFVAVPADLSNVIYIACANSLEGLSQPLQTRFRVFHVKAPIGEQHAQVMQAIYLDEINKSPMFAPTLKSEVLNSLAPLSVREAKQKISEAIGNILLELTEQEIEEAQILHCKLSMELRHLNIEEKRQHSKIGF